MSKLMEYKGFKASIMEAPKLTGDIVHNLPPGSALEVYPVDAFNKPPESWMRGPGVFVVPVSPNKGLWFNWRENSEMNTAVIPTVKGCNPITGMQTSGFHMEKYESKCPKHGCDFLAERFCPECNYKWPDRNYQSMSPSWWDGFRADDGTVRQFFFTEDELRDVATGLIGKENTVPAFGFAFYSPKERRPEPVYRGGPSSNIKLSNSCTIGYNSAQGVYGPSGSVGVTGQTSGVSWGTTWDSETKLKKSTSSHVMLGNSSNIHLTSMPVNNTFCCSVMDSYAPPIGNIVLDNIATEDALTSNLCGRGLTQEPVKDVSIGAGARISQRLNADSYALDTWRDTPDAVMTIYFVFQEMFNDIKAGGMRDLEGLKDGMLAGLVVG